MILDISLAARENADGALTLSFPWFARAVPGIFAAVVVLAGFGGEGGSAWSLGAFGWICLVMLLAAALYEERWVLDPKAKILSFRAGVFPLTRLKRWGFDEIVAVSLESFEKGRPSFIAEQARGPGAHDGLGKMKGRDARYAALVLERRDEERLVVEVLPHRRSMVLRKKALKIAALLGLPLNENAAPTGTA